MITLRPASADASFRRYFRVTAGKTSWIAMDAPPEQRGLPAVHARGRTAARGRPQRSAGRAQDLEHGFLLLTDLGDATYLAVLDGTNADRVVRRRNGALICSGSSPAVAGELPPYDAALLRRELRPVSRVVHCAPPRRSAFAAQQRDLSEHVRADRLASNLAQPAVYVHRDYMPRNLMVSEPNPGVLDFQDAVYGPISYDMASLVRDAFISWDEERVLDWTVRYWDKARRAGLPVGADFGDFYRDLEWMGLQRHLKVLGHFRAHPPPRRQDAAISRTRRASSAMCARSPRATTRSRRSRTCSTRSSKRQPTAGYAG